MAEYLVIRTDDKGDFEPAVVLRGVKRKAKVALRAIGLLMEEAAQEAFQEQRFGDFEWEPRYPNQDDPFVNIAGALADFESGAKEPKSRRFDRRPALFDTGALAASVSSSVVNDDTVEAGSNLEYAPIHQWGLVSTLRVSKSAKQRLAAWLITPRGRPFQRKFAFVLMPNFTQLDTEVVQRPFLGTTDELEKDTVATIEQIVTGVIG